MSDGPYRVQQVGGEEYQRVLASYEKVLGRSLKPDHRKIIADGFEVKGSFGITCRDAKSGEVAWAHEQDNLITDIGRFAFLDLGWNNVRIGFAPSTETPAVQRNSIPCDGSQTVVSGNLGNGTVTPSTYTKTWSTTYGVPAANRTLGTLFIGYYSGTIIDGNMGVVYCWAYTLLTPPKTQTTTQTIELVYKMAINPIY